MGIRSEKRVMFNRKVKSGDKKISEKYLTWNIGFSIMHYVKVLQ